MIMSFKTLFKAWPRCDTGVRAARRAHPQDIVVAPFYVDAGVLYQQFDDLVRRIAAVKDVADDMQTVYRQPLDQLSQRDHKAVGVDTQDGLEDLIVISYLIVVLVGLGVHQLVDDVRKVLRHGFAHL